jgi:prefoldin subunit 5
MQKQRLQILLDQKYMSILSEVMREENCRNESQAMEIIFNRYNNYGKIIRALGDEISKWESKYKNLEYEVRQKAMVKV